MFSRLRPLTQILEISLVSLFFIQSLRFLIGSLYSHVASATLVTVYPPNSIDPTLPGVITPEMLNNAIIVLGVVLALPVLMLIFGRFKPMFFPVVGLIVAGRVLMVAPDSTLDPIIAAELVVGGSFAYIAMLVTHRAQWFPYFFVLGFAGDQLIRAIGNTLDPLIAPELFNLSFALDANTAIFLDFFTIQVILSVVVLIATLLNLLPKRYSRDDAETNNAKATASVDPNRGILSIWGAIGLGGLLFLQISLLALPNALAGRTDSDYTLFVPVVMVATLLPLVPVIRVQLRKFISPFDSNMRGWVWLIIITLLIVIGLRIPSITIDGAGNIPIGGTLLAIAQFAVSAIWWWLVRPRGEREYNFAGLWLVTTGLVFALLITADLFTYEYAFVRNFAPPLDTLNEVVPPLLRGFRGLGLAIILLATFFCALPMIRSTRRVPWTGGTPAEALGSLILIVGLGALSAFAARPPQVQAYINQDTITVGTYNIHAGYSEFFNYDLEAIARTIQQSGANVVLLQEVEAGRLTSYGVDQTLWLARRLGMDRRFFPTNEGLQGLAVLSQIPIVFDDGVLLPSIDQQTGLQRVQIQPDEGAVTIYNTSLGLLLTGETLEEQEANQRQQLNTILATIEAHIQTDYGGQLGRALLGGTFHNVPSSPLMQTLAQTGFVDPFAGTNIELFATIRRANIPPARYDYIWLWGQALRASGVNVLPTNASDHLITFVGVTIRGG